MDSAVLLKLPLDWQVKIRDEMVSKLSLCINKDQAKTVAEETWENLSQDKFDKQQLTNKLKNYLLQHASDFTEWLYDFVQKTVEYYHETHLPLNKENLSETNTNTSNTDTINTNISNTNTSSSFMKPEKVEKLKESRSRLMKSALKDIHTTKSDSVTSSKSNDQSSAVNESEDKSATVDKKTKLLDALDQPLDKLILKEKIAKLQGQSVPLGVKTKSEKFKSNDTEKHKINTENFKPTNEKYKLSTENFNPKRKKNSFYKNLTLVNDSSGSSEQVEPAVNGEEESVKVVKVPKRCINYPNCEFGEKCRYIHPNNVPCKNWPNCFFGNNCAFLHPNQ